jgi:hypothetical protein
VRAKSFNAVDARNRLEQLWIEFRGSKPTKAQLDSIDLSDPEITKRKSGRKEGPVECAAWACKKILGSSDRRTARQRIAGGRPLIDGIRWSHDLEESFPNRVLFLEYLLVNVLGLSPKQFAQAVEALGQVRPDLLPEPARPPPTLNKNGPKAAKEGALGTDQIRLAESCQMPMLSNREDLGFRLDTRLVQ